MYHLQKLLPQHGLSRVMGAFANWRYPPFKNWMIQRFIRAYDVDMSEAILSDPEAYLCFNHFFTRHLKSEVRDLNKPTHMLISPVDGVISELGTIEQGTLLQAKGKRYSLDALTVDHTIADLFQGGSFVTLYLAPKDYHRVHMPFSGNLKKMIYVPGSLFSVNEQSVVTVPHVFTRNERVICLFDTIFGEMAVIFVGAMIVGSIHTAWHGPVRPKQRSCITQWDYAEKQFHYNRGEELGFFQMGSTVITLLPKNAVQLASSLHHGVRIRLGDVLGQSDHVHVK